MINKAESDNDDDAVLIDKAILMFWCNKLTQFNSLTFIIDVSVLLSLTVFFDLDADCELRCMILLLNWSESLSLI